MNRCYKFSIILISTVFLTSSLLAKTFIVESDVSGESEFYDVSEEGVLDEFVDKIINSEIDQEKVWVDDDGLGQYYNYVIEKGLFRARITSWLAEYNYSLSDKISVRTFIRNNKQQLAVIDAYPKDMVMYDEIDWDNSEVTFSIEEDSLRVDTYLANTLGLLVEKSLSYSIDGGEQLGFEVFVSIPLEEIVSDVEIYDGVEKVAEWFVGV